mmetsp:Transcript_31579/g.86355  ORF Transcript_31579/g.86355 Transcript_31579/m.86355 type:complete len:93 (-) Transcript_31579:1085-1363(-)
MFSTLPNATRVVFGTCDDSVPLIVECSGKNFICVSLKDLQAIAAFDIPNPTGAIAARCDDLIALRTERYLRDFALVAYQDRLACPSCGIVDS